MIIKISHYLLLIMLLTSHQVHAKNITLFAAASLTQPLTQIISHYENTTGVKVSAVYAASSTLARQIHQGAPADIYISANQRWMSYLKQNKKIHADSLITLLSNKLALIAPLSSQYQAIDLTNPQQLTQLVGDNRLALGNVDHVPVGLYAKQALTHLQLWDLVKDKFAFSANTRGALAFAEKGIVPAAIVYLTDAKASQKVKTLAIFPATSHETIQYPMALTNNRKTSTAVTDFYRYLESEQARSVFKQFAFELAPTTLKN